MARHIANLNVHSDVFVPGISTIATASIAYIQPPVTLSYVPSSDAVRTSANASTELLIPGMGGLAFPNTPGAGSKTYFMKYASEVLFDAAETGFYDLIINFHVGPLGTLSDPTVNTIQSFTMAKTTTSLAGSLSYSSPEREITMNSGDTMSIGWITSGPTAGSSMTSLAAATTLILREKV